MKSVLLRWLRGTMIVAAVAYFAALLSWSYPYLKARFSSSGATLEDPGKVESWPEAAAVRESLKRKLLSYGAEELGKHRVQVSLDGIHPLTPLVEAVFLVSARSVQASVPVQDQEPVFEHRMLDVGIRVERLIWALAILGGIILLARDLWKQPDGGLGVQASPAGEEINLQGDLPKLLYQEARYYERLCNLTYARSTLLLRGAIITAVGGLGALFFLPANAEQATNSNDLWILLTRSYGVVLVVNALALVFLRQYRHSSDDFRYMLNLRWRRMNAVAVSLDDSRREQVNKALLMEPYPEERLKKKEAPAETKDLAEEDDTKDGVLALLKRMLKSKEEK